MIPEHSTKLISKTEVARDTVRLQFEKSAEFSFTAGQFLSLKFNEKAWRAYSIASMPTDETIELIVRLIPGGVGSEGIRAAKVGDGFTFRGPFGHFGLSENPDAVLVFCGTGTGIAPFKSMIQAESAQKNPLREAQGKPRKMILLYGGRDVEDLAYLDEMSDWSSDLDRVFLGLSRQENLDQVRENDMFCGKNVEKFKIEKCRITEFLKNLEFENSAEFYICGNGDMVLSVREILDIRGVEKSRIFQERFN